MSYQSKLAKIGLALAVVGKSNNAMSQSAVLGVERLVLDAVPVSDTKICYAGTGKTNSSALTHDTFTVVPGASSSNVKLAFSVGEISSLTSSKPLIVFIAYSTIKLAKPTLVTKNTTYPLLLGGSLQVLTAYAIPQVPNIVQSQTTIGQSASTARTRLTFDVTLDMAKVNQLSLNSLNQLYLQAAVLPADEFNAGNYANMILSEVDTLNFASTCSGSSTLSAGSTGAGKTSSSGGTTVSKTTTASGVSKSSASTGKTSSSSTGKTGTGSSSSGKSK